MLAMSGVKKGQVTARRIWNAVLGAAFLGYGLYLLLFFQGGHYVMFYYVFVVPILMIVRFFRGRAAYRAHQQAVASASAASPPPSRPSGQPGTGAGEWGSPAGGDQPSGYGAYQGPS